MTIGLTQRQQDLLHFIDRYQRASDGVSPSFAEMAEAIGNTSKAGVTRLLDALEERGRIRRLSNRARAIELLDPAFPVSVAPDGAPLFMVSCKRKPGFIRGRWGNHQTFSGARAS